MGVFEGIKKMFGIKKYKVKNFTKRRKVGGRTKVYDSSTDQWLFWYLISGEVDDPYWSPDLELSLTTEDEYGEVMKRSLGESTDPVMDDLPYNEQSTDVN